MITVTKHHDGRRVDISLPSPLVYVDHGGIGILAREDNLGKRFSNALLGTGGTLYLSCAHLLELYGLGDGPTYQRIRTFLESFGAYFAMLDCDYQAVITREQAWPPGLQNAALDVDFITALAANWDQNQPLSVGVLLRLIDEDPDTLTTYKEFHRQHRENLYSLLENARRTYRQDPKARQRLDGKSYTHKPGTPATAYLRSQFSREIIRTHEPLKENDGLDFEHAVVALAYADHVVLDTKWAARTARFPAPTPLAKVWKIGELDKLTDHLARMSS